MVSLYRPVRNFNPHHHAGGDAGLNSKDRSPRISIHTTTQVVTVACEESQAVTVISIHTTTQVVTNPNIYCCPACGISIHTTTQVVTEKIIYDVGDLIISIHTTTQVVTLNGIVLFSWPFLFQSTPPRRW